MFTRDWVGFLMWTAAYVGIFALCVHLFGCASPHFLVGDALECEKGGEYRETASGTTVSCAEGLRWTGPMSDNAANTALTILKAASEAAPGVP